MDVTQLLDAFALGPYIEIVVTGLPEKHWRERRYAHSGKGFWG